MPTSIRSLSQLSVPRLPLTRLLTLVLGASAILLLALLLAAGPAGAVVVKGGGEPTVGLQPRSTTLHAGAGPEAKQFANPAGAPVLPANKTYAVYWDPTDNYHGDWQSLIDTFFQNVGTGSGSLASVYAVDAQYTDAANQHADYLSTFQGAYTDTDSYPSTGNCIDPQPLQGVTYPEEEPAAITCITNAQIETELRLFIADHGLQTGMGTIFYLLTPPGVTVCLDAGGSTGHCSDYEGNQGDTSYKNSFCSYHSDINPGNPTNGGSGTILYAAIPWISGGLGDGHINDGVSAYDCQDGGFDPSSKPIEQQEKSKEKTTAEEEAFEKLTIEEQHKQEIAILLEGPHQQEPNQPACPSPDGYCDTGLGDLIINQIAVEQQNIVTDPLLSSWKDPSGDEATDECRNFFANDGLGGSVTANEETGASTLLNQVLGSGSYYLNNAFDLAALKLPYPGIPCQGGVSLAPEFTSPNPVNSGEVVGFNGMESYLTLNWGTIYSAGQPKPTYATYTWNFGDGTPAVTGFAPGAPTGNSPATSPCGAQPWEAPCAASTFHSYQYGGTYQVTLTVTDTGGNIATVTKSVTVVGPAPPAPPAPPSPPSGGGSSSPGVATAGGSGASSSTPGAAAKALPGPVASQAAATHSLTTALSKGLVVNYSVNEQVAGQFQVLLASSVAKRIGLHGAPATGMPPGSAPSIVIGKAILVTTKGGRNSVRIQFGKKTAAKLRKLSKVSLLIRLVVRNSSRGAPSTTVLSTVTLSR